jgi:hypothetical protein
MHSEKRIFVHISKTAGMYVTHAHRQRAATGDVFLSGPDVEIVGRPLRTRTVNAYRRAARRFRLPLLVKHASAVQIRSAMPRAWSTYTSFAVVRDPVARALSMYRYARTAKGRPRSDELGRAFRIARETRSFDEFCVSGSLERCAHLPFFMPQANYVMDPDGTLLVDLLLSVDELDRQLTERLGLPGTGLRSKVNASPASSWEPVTDEARAVIQRLYARDVDLLETSR